MIVAHIEYQAIDTFGNYTVLNSCDKNADFLLIWFCDEFSPENFKIISDTIDDIKAHPETMDRAKIEITTHIVGEGKTKIFYKNIITFKKG